MTEMPRYNPGADPYQKPAAAMVSPTAPPIMNTIYFMLLGAAVLQVISTIFGVSQSGSQNLRRQITEQMEAQNVPGMTPDMVDMTVAISLGAVVVTALMSVAAYIVIGLFIKKGMGWARIVGTVLAAVSAFQLIGLSMPGGIATILQVLLGAAAIVMCYIAPAASFFTERKNFRLARKAQ